MQPQRKKVNHRGCRSANSPGRGGPGARISGCLKSLPEYFRQLYWTCNHHVRGNFTECVRSKAVSDAAGRDPSIAAGEHVDRRVADDHGAVERSLCLLQKCFHAQWIRLLGFKTVAAINAEKE